MRKALATGSIAAVSALTIWRRLRGTVSSVASTSLGASTRAWWRDRRREGGDDLAHRGARQPSGRRRLRGGSIGLTVWSIEGVISSHAERAASAQTGQSRDAWRQRRLGGSVGLAAASAWRQRRLRRNRSAQRQRQLSGSINEPLAWWRDRRRDVGDGLRREATLTPVLYTFTPLRSPRRRSATRSDLDAWYPLGHQVPRSRDA